MQLCMVLCCAPLPPPGTVCLHCDTKLRHSIVAACVGAGKLCTRNIAVAMASAKVADRPSAEQVFDQPVTDDDDTAKFKLPVDSEHRSKELRLLSLARPHMLAFWVNSLAFCVSFMATFAAAPLIESEYSASSPFTRGNARTDHGSGMLITCPAPCGAIAAQSAGPVTANCTVIIDPSRALLRCWGHSLREKTKNPKMQLPRSYSVCSSEVHITRWQGIGLHTTAT